MTSDDLDKAINARELRLGHKLTGDAQSDHLPDTGKVIPQLQPNPSAAVRLIDAATSAMRERMVVASLLDDPACTPGPNVSTALAYAPGFWDDTIAGKLAAACCKCAYAHRQFTYASVAEFVEKEYRPWLAHPSFNGRAAAIMAVAEHEAYDLVVRYKGKRLASVLGQAWHETKQHPEKAKEIAAALRETLGEFLETT